MACPPEAQGNACELQIGVSPGKACPAGTRVTWGLSHSITPLTAPWRLLWQGCSAEGLEVKLRPVPSPQVWALLRSSAQQAASVVTSAGARNTMRTLSI